MLILIFFMQIVYENNNRIKSMKQIHYVREFASSHYKFKRYVQQLNFIKLIISTHCELILLLFKQYHC